MVNLVTGLAVGVGLALGALVVLVVDTYVLGQRLQTAVSEKNQLQDERQQLVARFETLRTEYRVLARRLGDVQQEAQLLAQAKEEAEAQVTAVSGELAQAKDNLRRLGAFVEELEQKVEQLQTQWETAVAERDALQQKADALQREHDAACQRLTAVMETNRRLEADNAQLEPLRLEKERLAQRLELAEKQAAEWQAKADALVDKATDVQGLYQKVETLEAQLRQSLQKTAVRTKSAAGIAKSAQLLNLRQIRGIGPAYARRLEEAGIRSIVDLASASLDKVSDAVGLREERIVDWQEQARQIIGE